MESQKRTFLESLKFHYYKIPEFIRLLLGAFWVSRIGLVIPICVYFIFFLTDQGYDLLLALPEQGSWGSFRIIWSYIDILLLASAAWFIPRISMNLDYEKAESKGEMGEAEKSINKFVPRFLGVLTLVLFATSIFFIYWQTVFFFEQADCQNKLSVWPFLLSAFILTLLIVWLTQKIYNDLQVTHKSVWFIVSCAVLVPGLVITPLVLNLSIVSKLLLLSISTLLLAILFCELVTVRKLKTANTGNNGGLYFADQEKMVRTMKVITLVYSVCAFLLYNFVPGKALIFPTSVAFTGLIVYTSLATTLAIIQNGKYYYLTWLIIILFLSNWWLNSNKNPIHDIAAIDIKKENFQRPSLETHFNNWVKNRQKIIEESDSYPVFLVIGQGGGSRAAFYTNTVLSSLHDQTNGRFSDHCYAISTASGSSFGAGAFLAFLKAKKMTGDTSMIRVPVEYKNTQVRANRIPFEQNYLSASLIHLLGRDFWCSVIPGLTRLFSNYDRERCLDDGRIEYMHEAIDKMFPDSNDKPDNAFDQPFLNLWADKMAYEIPLFFPNTTRVEDGSLGLISPLDDGDQVFAKSVDILSHMSKSEKTIKLSTAVNLSARFPIINAGSKVEGLGYFVDGGYYDNMGSTAIIEIMDLLDSLKANSPDTLFKKIDFYLLRIYNEDLRPNCDSGNYPNKPQLSIPLNTILAARAAHTQYLSEYLSNKFNGKTYDFKLDHTLEITDGDSKGKVIFPVARFLSKRAAEGIEKSFDKTGIQLKDKTSVLNFQAVKDLIVE